MPHLTEEELAYKMALRESRIAIAQQLWDVQLHGLNNDPTLQYEGPGTAWNHLSDALAKVLATVVGARNTDEVRRLLIDSALTVREAVDRVQPPR